MWDECREFFADEPHATAQNPAKHPWRLDWCGLGELFVHPAHLLTEEVMIVHRLWRAHRGEGGTIPMQLGGQIVPVPLPRAPGPLPFSGGLAEQPAITMEAFAIMDRATATVRAWKGSGT